MFLRFLLCLVIFSGQVMAAQISAKGGTRSEILEAVNMAKPGDVVMIPAGTFNFDGSITFKAGITIMGAGKDKTILKKSGNVSSSTFTIDGSNGLKARISSMTIIGLKPSTSPGIKVAKGARKFRIDNIAFKNCGGNALGVFDNSTGVIDHNTFIDNEVYSIVVYGDGVSTWNKPVKLGTEDAVYIEDNRFEMKNVLNKARSHHIASNNGSKYVFRYNTIDDGNLNAQAIDVHGNKFSWPKGSRYYEIYNNKMKVTHRWLGMRIRGGDGVIFDNELSGDITYPIDLMHEGKDGDGNCSYPCEDQIRDLYMWGNTYNGKPSPINVRHPSLIKENRDFFVKQKEGYKPFQYPHPLTLSDNKTSVSKKQTVTQNKELKIYGAVCRADGTVNISYTIPQNLNDLHSVNIVIYNAQGRMVRRIINGHNMTGEHSVLWDGRDEKGGRLSKGLYTIELNAGNMTVVNNIMLFK